MNLSHCASFTAMFWNDKKTPCSPLRPVGHFLKQKHSVRTDYRTTEADRRNFMWARNYCSLFGQNSYRSSLNIAQIICDKMQLSSNIESLLTKLAHRKTKGRPQPQKAAQKDCLKKGKEKIKKTLQKALFSFSDSKKVRTTCAGYSEVESLVVLSYFSVSQP